MFIEKFKIQELKRCWSKELFHGQNIINLSIF